MHKKQEKYEKIIKDKLSSTDNDYALKLEQTKK
jgi:hypothetical protein